MVVHFRELNTHKFSVLELYRQIIRHTKRLPAKHEDRLIIYKNVRFLFKKEKKQMSPWIVRNKMELGYLIELKLREIYSDKGDINEIIEFIGKNNFIKRKPSVLTNKMGQPMKIDLNNLQDRETQKLTNQVNRYVQEQQKLGLLPKIIDPLIRESIIKDEAVFKSSILDLDRIKKVHETGPYKVHITSANKIKFIRGPWAQNSKISKMILNLQRKEQNLYNMINYYQENKKLYEYETNWNKIYYKNGDDWSESINELINELQTDLNKRLTFFKNYSNFQLPLKLKNKQLIADSIFNKFEDKFHNLLTDIDKIQLNPFNEMLGEESLSQLIKKHRLDRNK